MLLPVNSHQNSTDDDGKLRLCTSGWAKSNSADIGLARVVMAVNHAPKAVNPSTANQRKNDVPNGSGLSEMAEGKVRNKNQGATSLETNDITENRGDDSRDFCGFNRRLSRRFSTARMAWRWPVAQEYPIGTKLNWKGDRKWKIRSGHACGSGWPGSVYPLSLSVSFSFFLFLSHSIYKCGQHGSKSSVGYYTMCN